MANSPFNPSRAALGDISNTKLFRSALKTPLSTVHELSEPVEHNIGEAVKPDVGDLSLFQTDFSPDLLLNYPDHFFPPDPSPALEDSWQDPSFAVIEEEISIFLNGGLQIGFIPTPD